MCSDIVYNKVNIVGGGQIIGVQSPGNANGWQMLTKKKRANKGPISSTRNALFVGREINWRTFRPQKYGFAGGKPSAHNALRRVKDLQFPRRKLYFYLLSWSLKSFPTARQVSLLTYLWNFGPIAFEFHF